MTFSHRAAWNTTVNRLTRARQDRGATLLDLTESNPTRAGLEYPLDELSEAIARGARARYEPEPLGLPAAREALASDLGCQPADLVLTASTSEAYAFLFKLLCDPGDALLTAVPSYPLLEHLSALESVELHHFQLELHRRWEIDPSRVRNAITSRTRAIVVVNPNNPTGSFVVRDEQDAIARFALPILCDEVFLPYPLEGDGSSFVRDDVLTFTLGGLSKSAGLPHFKLGWIAVSGPRSVRRDAIAALELIADTYLSLATPVQAALPELLRIAPRIRAAIAGRIRQNLATLDGLLAAVPAVRRLPVEGGWSAVLRMPNVESDEAFAVRMIEEHGVAVHPGYLFDFAGEGFVVVSLLTVPETLVEGIRRLVATMNDER
jgi:alanine-synthesizing transaminase